MRNLLITGGAGFIGSNFVRHILRKYPGYRIVVYDKLTYAGNLENLKDVAADFRGRYAFVRGDICDAERVREVIRAHQVDAVVNFAAESVVRDTYIPVHLGHSIRVETIEDLYERYARETDVRVDSNGTEIVPVKGVLRALSFRNGMGNWAQITHMTRHRYQGDVLTLTQKWGQVTVTPNHSVYNADAQLVSADSDPELLCVRKINFDRSRLKDAITLGLRGCYPREEEGRIYHGSKKYPAPRQVWALRQYEGETLKALLRFLAAYVAEGNATYNKANGGWLVCIANQDLALLESWRQDVAAFSNSRGVITQREAPNAHQLVFSSRLIYQLVTQLCGQYSTGKHVPHFIFMLKNEYKQTFLDTYLQGDGSETVYKSVVSQRLTTTSPQLAAEIALLLSLLEKDYSLSIRDGEQEHSSRRYSLHIVSSYDNRVHHRVERIPYDGYVYDLTVEGAHNFAAGIGNIVVHNTHVDRSLVEPDAFIRTDVFGTYVLLELVKELGLERIHAVSTDEVYGAVLEGRSKEADPLHTRSPYSASKAGGDLMCLAYFTSFGVPVTITRGSNNIGPYQYPEKVLPLFITNAIDNLPLPLYGDGRQMRDYQYVLDHCAGIDVVLHHGVPGEVYNLGSGVETYNVDMARALLDLLGKPHTLIQPVKDRPGHDRRYALDITKIRSLGWEPTYPFAQSLELTVRWYVENEWWWRPIKSGAHYREYYEQQYAERLAQGRPEGAEV